MEEQLKFIKTLENGEKIEANSIVLGKLKFQMKIMMHQKTILVMN